MSSDFQDAPNLEYHRKAAKALLKAYRAQQVEATAAFSLHFAAHPKKKSSHASYNLSDAQRVYAKLLGFESWAELKSSFVQGAEETSHMRDANPTTPRPQVLSSALTYCPPEDLELQIYWYGVDGQRHDLGHTANHEEFSIPKHRWWAIEPTGEMDAKDWERILHEIQKHAIPGFVGGKHLTDACLQSLGQATHLQCLDLNRSQRVSGRGLRQLQTLTQLRSLSVALNSHNYPGTENSLHVVDDDLAFLANLAFLENLDLGSLYQLTDRALAFLPTVENLRRVHLSMTRMGDRSLDQLREAPYLAQIDAGTAVTDQGLQAIRQLPCFVQPSGQASLGLLKCPYITDVGMKTIGQMAGVTSLQLPSQAQLIEKWMRHLPNSLPRKVRYTGASLTHLHHLPELKEITGLDGELADDPALEALGRMPRLRSISMGGAVAGDKGYASLANSTSIEEISAWNAQNITTVDALANLPRLLSLFLGGPQLKDEGLSLMPQFKNLRRFLIGRNNAFTDDCFRHLAQAPQLTHLVNMYLPETGDQATGHLADSAQLIDYRVFANGRAQTSDLSLQRLSAIDSLEHLVLDGLPLISNEGIFKLTRLPRLKNLEVTRCPQISHGAFAGFHKRVSISADLNL